MAAELNCPTIEDCDSTSNKTTKHKRGGTMGYGNVSRKAQKGFYLSAVGRSMVAMLQITEGETESGIVEQAVRKFFIARKAEWDASGMTFVDILENHNYVIPRWMRPVDKRLKMIEQSDRQKEKGPEK